MELIVSGKPRTHNTKEREYNPNPTWRSAPYFWKHRVVTQDVEIFDIY